MKSLVSAFGPIYLALRDRRPSSPSAIRRAQERILRRLVRQLSPLEIGKRFGLAALANADLVAEFRRSVPLTRYCDVGDLIERVRRGERDLLFPGRPVAMAQTSGTTSNQDGGERYIPQSEGLLRNQTLGGVASLSRLLERTGPSLLGGGLLMLGGSSALESNAWGVPEGDLSGIVVSHIPRLLQGSYEPGPKIALEADWKRKIDLIAKRCAGRDIRLVSGIASWMHVLFEAVCRERGEERVDKIWNLRGLIHGGATIGPTIPMLTRHLSPSQWMMEVYPASEGFLAVGSRPWRLEEGAPPPLEALSDHGIFLEFLPEGESAERAVGPEALEAGQLYTVLLTTPSGLLRYELGDLVQGEGPGMLRIAGRVGARLSAFGEHVEGMQIAAALESACHRHAATVAEYHVAPVFPRPGECAGQHEWWVEFLVPPSDPEAFLASLDGFLQENVLDYAAHRRDDLQLARPRLCQVPIGTFHRALERSGKLGGQHKIPQAASDRSFADLLSESST